MVTPATLTAVSITTTNNNNNSSSINSTKRKNEENIISALTKKSTVSRISSPQHSTNEIDNSFIRSIPTFRIPKIARSNNSIPSSDDSQSSPTQTNDSISSSSSSSQVLNIKTNVSTVHRSNDELNSQKGKRKFSLSQYKEHKRLKSNDIIQDCSGDIDMRINTMENIKNSPPTAAIDDDSSILPNNESVVSPKMNDISKDVVIKSNLSEPGVKKLIKKKVIWADEKNEALVQTSVFEIDDSEVTDIHAFARQCATNISIAQIEKLLERDLRKRQGLSGINSFDNDDKQNLLPLPTLIRILLPDTIQIPLVKSQERVVQEEREKTVLQALLMHSFLPDSPGEPDGDLLGNSTIEQNEPKLIPFDDNNASSASNQVSSVNNNNNSTSINVSLASTNPTATVTPSLSSLSLDNLSPEVAQIFAQAKGNLTSATANNPSSTIVNGQINSSTPVLSTNPTLASISNLNTTSNLLSALLNITRPNGIETTNVPPTNPIVNPVLNLPINFNIPPPNHFSLNQLLASALSLGIPPTTAFNNSIFQPPSSIVPTINSNNNNNSAINPSTTRFFSPLDQQSSRFNQNTNSRGNSRGRIYRRGLHNNNNNNNNNNNRRDYYQNRNPNNRNIFS